MFAYAIITAYYFQNIRYYRKNLLASENPKFFIGFLTFKIVTWGLILAILLYRT